MIDRYVRNGVVATLAAAPFAVAVAAWLAYTPPTPLDRELSPSVVEPNAVPAQMVPVPTSTSGDSRGPAPPRTSVAPVPRRAATPEPAETFTDAVTQTATQAPTRDTPEPTTSEVEPSDAPSLPPSVTSGVPSASSSERTRPRSALERWLERAAPGMATESRARKQLAERVRWP